MTARKRGDSSSMVTGNAMTARKGGTGDEFLPHQGSCGKRFTRAMCLVVYRSQLAPVSKFCSSWLPFVFHGGYLNSPQQAHLRLGAVQSEESRSGNFIPNSLNAMLPPNTPREYLNPLSLLKFNSQITPSPFIPSLFPKCLPFPISQTQSFTPISQARPSTPALTPSLPPQPPSSPVAHPSTPQTTNHAPTYSPIPPRSESPLTAHRAFPGR